MPNTPKINLSNLAEATVLDALCEHIAVLDPSGHIVFVNQAWKDFAKSNGYTDKNYGLGQNYYAHLSEPEIKEGMQSVLQNKIPYYAYEYPCHSPTQSRWFWLYVTPLHNTQKQIIGIVTSHINITARKHAEQQVDALQKQVIQAEKDQVLEETAGAAAHEINQPLTAVLGLSEMLTKRTDLPSDIQEDIQMIFESSQQISAIIKKMQQAKTYVSKPYVGKTNIVDFQESQDKNT